MASGSACTVPADPAGSGNGDAETAENLDLGNASTDKGSTSVVQVVASHYNSLDEKGLMERTKSRIFYLRNFNNWIKSMLIGEYVQIIGVQNQLSNKKKLHVLDLACGKGGDLLKWKKAEIGYLVCADIAATSIEQCEQRYVDMAKRKDAHERRPAEIFEAEFIVADCTQDRLRDLYKRKDITFDLVSCQFSFHYCFESLQQVERMLLNVSECLRPGGYFIGTTPDANQIVSRLRDCDGLKFGNDVFSVTFADRNEFPLFGAKYDFHLDGVVDCPEFLVHFPLLEKLAEKHGLRLVCRQRFDEYFDKVMNADKTRKGRGDDGRQLLGRMQALETFPPFDDTELVGDPAVDYVKAKERVDELAKSSGRPERVGTLSQSEWEAITMYVVFAFEKVAKDHVKKRKLGDDDDGASRNKLAK